MAEDSLIYNRLHNMIEILEESDATIDEKRSATSTIVEAIAPEMLEAWLSVHALWAVDLSVDETRFRDQTVGLTILCFPSTMLLE